MERVVDLRGVEFSYGGHLVLNDIHLAVDRGDFLGIIGPNGGGKTTLLRIILGLLTPYRGEVRVFGSVPKKAAQKMGYVPQYSLFDPTFPITVIEVVLMGLLRPSHLGVWYSKKEKRAAMAAMEETGVYDLRARHFGRLSGGQRQRVLIARALVSNPLLLLLDEPTASVDHQLEEDIYSLLKEINQDITIILVSHDLGVISSCVNRVACVNQRLVVHSTTDLDRDRVEEIYGRPITIIEHECLL